MEYLYSVIAIVIILLIVFFYVRKRHNRRIDRYHRDWEGDRHSGMTVMADYYISPISGISKETLKKQFINGFLDFFCFEDMTVGQKVSVTAEIFISQELYEQTFNKQALQEIDVSEEMTLKLRGDAFTIVPKRTETQLIIADKKTLWEWDVTPQKHGIKTLELLLSANLHEFFHGVYDLPVQIKTITVKRNFLYTIKKFWKNNWQWIISTLIGSGTIIAVLKALGYVK